MFLNDDDMIRRQAQRLYALTNNFQRELPLHLLNKERLRAIVCSYGGIYMLPVIQNPSSQAILKKLKKAHRFFVANISQFYSRSPHWDPDNKIFEAYDRYIYGEIRSKTFATMLHNQKMQFGIRYTKYIASFSNHA